MNLVKTYNHLKNDLHDIENSLKQTIQADNPILSEAAIQLLEAGGKRIRPAFVLLASQFGNYNLDYIKKVAVSLELIHMATLVHDDVVDKSDLRRGKPTIMKMYGNRIAMHTGDYILARALEEITKVNHPEIHKLLSKTLVEVCIGEIEQIRYKYNYEQNLRDYLRRIKRKTALLIATSCKLGALAGGLDKKSAHYMYQYGYNIGMSFQIIDDILDITSTPETLGKPTGNDLIQGHVTLPVLYAMKHDRFYQNLIKLFSQTSEISKEQVNELLFLLKETDAIEKSYDLSNRYVERALNILDKFPDIQAKSSLIQIAHYVQNRRK
ncbi:MAG TPA: heptaprenyl diphosphate synthase component II [Bacillota bacterium]|nr:heptaprenyl diphosphate synthase component II [Bacillota bacterium]